MSSSRLVRLLVVPAVLLALVTSGTFALAKLSLAKPDVPSGRDADGLDLGDAHRGEIAFSKACAGCHGEGGEGGGIGPRLVGNPISLADAKVQIDVGGGAMPGGLVTGAEEADVLAYLATILKRGQTP